MKTLGHWRDRPVKMLEIGSHEGRSAIWWSQNILVHPSSTLTCVDPWTKAEHRYQRFQTNIHLARAKNVRAVRKSSADIREGRQEFDLIYLDGDHHAHMVYRDLLTCWSLLKPGGVLICDDYEWKKEGVIGPKVAINGFLQSFAPFIKVLSKGYQVIIKRIK